MIAPLPPLAARTPAVAAGSLGNCFRAAGRRAGAHGVLSRNAAWFCGESPESSVARPLLFDRGNGSALEEATT